MAANVIESIHKVLVEFETHPRELADLCFLTFSDVRELQSKLDFSGSSDAYVTHLIKVLASYGRLPDNTHALVKLLEAVKAHWGVDKQARIDELIEEFEQSCADSLPQHPPQTLLPIGPNPYRGLKAFREEDVDLFFGRDDYIEKLAQAVQDHPFTAVIGASGSGKSSLVWAGLIPRLRQQGNWQVIAFRPGLFASERNPLLPLALAVRKTLNPDQDEVERLSKAVDLAKKLKNGDCTLAQILSLLRDKDPNTSILLFADQFEELYTTCPDPEEQRRFLDVLLPTVGVQTSVCRCILTMRADFLSKALAYRPFADALQGRDLKIGPMQREELRQAIEQPAALRNVQIEDGLSDRILEAVAAKPGELPLVQFTLTELWLRQTPPTADSQGRLTHAAYEEIGGVQQALAQYAEREFNKLTKDEQQRAQYIFTQLVQPGAGTEDTKRIATRAEIGEADWPLVAKLADARLVVTGQEAAYSAAQPQTSPPGRGRGGSPAQPPDSRTHPLPLPGGELDAFGDSPDATPHPLPLPGGELDAFGDSPDATPHPLPLPGGELAGVPCDTVDVAHEALIRGWQRLREWIEADREFRAWQERLRSALRQWQASNYDDGALLRGAPLAEAEQWLHARTFTRPEEPQFIQASLDLRDREQREREAQQQQKLKLTQENLELTQNNLAIQKKTKTWLAAGLIIVALLAIGAFWGFWQANQQKIEAENQKAAAVHQSRISLIRALVAFALQEDAQASRERSEDTQANRERAALLAYLASKLNDHFEGGGKLQTEVYEALRTIFRTRMITEGYGYAAEGDALVDLACCQSVNFKKTLTPDDLKKFVGEAIDEDVAEVIRNSACPKTELPDTQLLLLRSKPMTTIVQAIEALSLNVRQESYGWNYPIQYVGKYLEEQNWTRPNRFERQGKVVIDHATGLMWEQSGSLIPLLYESEDKKDAQDYIKKLNEQNFAGHNDWRLPTVEELLSLVEEEQYEVFRLTEESFSYLKEKDDVPEDVLKMLKPLENEQFMDEEDFVNTLKQCIGEAHTLSYKKLVVDRAKDTLKINPIFDYRQVWCWSADRIKGEGSADWAWYVYFHYGGVNWPSLGSYGYVRAVRSWQ